MAILIPLLLLLSCTPQQQLIKGERIERPEIGRNDPSTVSAFQGRVLLDSPIILNSQALPKDELARFLNPKAVLILEKSVLEYDCSQAGAPRCMTVKQNEVARPTTTNKGTWAYPPDSPEFLEVNAFYHAKKSIAEFFRLQQQSVAASQGNFDALSHIPPNVHFWHHATDSTLKVYTHCQRPGRPAFLFAGLEVCLGDHPQVSDLNFAEDPSIIHHEVGHFFSTVLFNQRNTGLSPERRLSFGGRGYSEMDLISEGLSDWFAHNISKRTSVFTWAGGFVSSDRPVSESDPLHEHNSIGFSPDGPRLSYPQYINYYHYDPQRFLPEDVQQAGMIISHFLVALGGEIEKNCGVDAQRSRELVFYLIQETLNELGDLSTSNISETWVGVYTPPNPRVFAQTLGRNFLRVISGRPTCNGILFSQDKLEQLIDSYGLLLFRTYGQGTPVVAANRRVSNLLPKSSLQLDRSEDAPPNGALIFDNALEVAQRLSSLRAAGLILPQDLGKSNLANTNNNNANSKITAGEVVGIALNLYNDGNVTMGGVQTLAAPWDHVKVENGVARMCNTFEDNFPSLSEGGASVDVLPLNDGDCGYTTRENGSQLTETNEIIAPICFVLMRDENETRWVNQQTYMQAQGGNISDCLVESDPLSCYFRAIPGANQAWYSKIDPKSTWQGTYSQSDYFNNNSFSFEGSNIMLFEVNANLAPGTELNCRFRARFTNCNDCWHDPDSTQGSNYQDFEFAGARPYRIFNINFTVLD